MRFLFVVFLVLFSGCFQKREKTKAPLLINGAGASFPYIIYSRWFSDYHTLEPEVTINYQSIGSSGGVRQFLKGTLDFGATDVPLSEKDRPKGEGKNKDEVIHIPTVLGAVAVTYNLEGLKDKVLQFDGETLAQIFMGGIKTWNHPRLKSLNTHTTLPAKPIVTVYRADGSGTTASFTEYLAGVEERFFKQLGKGKSVNWPVGIGGKGNEGVVGMVKKIGGSIGYIGASYGRIQKLPLAKIKNKSGAFVYPDEKSIKAAAENVVKNKKDYKISLINAGGVDSYPLSAFTYLIFSENMSLPKKQIFLKFLKWSVLGPGQELAASLFFVPLPDNVKQAVSERLSKIKIP